MRMKITRNIPQSLLNSIKKMNWYRHGIYRQNFLAASVMPHGLTKAFFRDEWLNRSFPQIQLGCEAYITEDDFKEISNEMFKKIEKERNYLSTYIKKYREENEESLELSRKINAKNVNKLSNNELAHLFNGFIKKTISLSHWLWSMEFLNNAIDKFVSLKIKAWKPEWLNEKIVDFLNEISYLEQKLPFQKEIEEIMRLKESDLKNKLKIDALYDTYSWLNINVWDGVPFTREEYARRIKKMILDRNNIIKRISENEEKAQRASKLIDQIDDAEIRALLKIIRELIYLKTERIDVYSISFSQIFPLIKEIEKILKISHEEFLKLMPEEIIESLKFNRLVIDKSEVNKREKYAVVWFNERVHYFYEQAYFKIREVLTKKDYSSVRIIKGTICFKGVVNGKVKVLLTEKDIAKIEKGDILIANLTNPNYNPVFEKISGVVTDEGGILCHSAIMAREYRIPCIVGTKIATKVLKDGDLVEVDANKGIVRKLR